MNLSCKNLIRLALIGLAASTIAACASHPAPAPAAPQPAQPQQPPPEQPPEANEAPQPPSGPTPGSQQDFVINVGELVYFDFDKFDVRADAQPILDGQAAWLRRYEDVRVRIEGNCDERGTREYNLALGARRANAVRDYLIAHGIAAGRITTISYGKERPLDPGSDEQAWARNRNARTAITEGAR
jgi:peptidoglycan-associated lipoprotein